MIHFNIPVCMEDRHGFQTIYVELQAFKNYRREGFLFKLQILCPLSPVYPLTVSHSTPLPQNPVSTRMSPPPTEPDL